MSEKEPEPIKKLSTAFEEMFETATKVKGERFTEMVGMIVNSGALVRLMSMAIQDSLEAGRFVLTDNDNHIRQSMTRILNQNLAMFAEAAGLSEADLEEASRLATEMQKKIDQAESELEDDK